MSVDQLGCVGINENISQYLLKWIPPDNINNFDLSHYEVTVTGPSANLTVGCIDTSTTFILNLGATMDDTEDNATVNVRINVVAVNQCGQRGIATESTNGMVLPLRKCMSNSSEVTLKMSAILWVALLSIAMILPAP
ncbi:MAG: hypothetical protein MJE68_30845, partial [Proteobacteria bacterium]|nr:hypothetical protein [Pseudomonadota bacterium]